jgi:hypothetical protein
MVLIAIAVHSELVLAIILIKPGSTEGAINLIYT